MRAEACAAAREALPVETSAPTSHATVRAGEMEGILRVVGEQGYRAASVRAVLEYSGGHRKQFYDHFDSLEDCYAQACKTWIERLGVDLLEAAIGAEGWQASVQAGLVRLFSFVSEEPAISRALLVEVQVAGGAALADTTRRSSGWHAPSTAPAPACGRSRRRPSRSGSSSPEASRRASAT
jgi:AcrR family transcriptional regulator